MIEQIYLQNSQERLRRERKFPLRFDGILDVEDEDEIWHIEPVPIRTFVKDYLQLAGLSKAQGQILDEIFTKKPAKAEKVFQIEQAILRVGQGGGKNYISTIIVVYAIYIWCCLQNPHKFFNLEYHEPFDILNFSQVNEQQARNVFFRTLSNLMKRTHEPGTNENWFTRHMGFRIAEYGRKDIKEKELYIPSRDRNKGGIRVYCLDSTAKSVEGYTIWMYILDEPSRANTPVKYATAKKQYNTAHNNANTRFEPFQYFGCMFAYPEQEVNDLLMETFDKHSINPKENSYEINENVLTAWFDTFVFNPKKSKAAYLRAHKTDPIDADRRWRAIVPPNEFGFFMPHMEKIDECANPDIFQPVKWQNALTRRKGTERGKSKILDFTALELTEIKGDEKERRWGGDFAVSNDSLVLVGGYLRQSDEDTPDFVYKERTKEGTEKEITISITAVPVIDTILVWKPKKNKPIDYQNVEDIITSLLGDHFYNSRSLHFDKFNTESIKQKLLDIGIYDCETLTFSNPQQLAYGRLTRHLIWNNAIEYPDNPLLQREMKRLLLLNNTKLDHPAGTGESKDIWDALIICVQLLMTHAADGGALDIDMGENVNMDKEIEEEIKLYETVYTAFVKKYNRNPHSNVEMSSFFKTKFNMAKSPSEIEYLKQSWKVDREMMDKKIPGMDMVKGETSQSSLDIGLA